MLCLLFRDSPKKNQSPPAVTLLPCLFFVPLLKHFLPLALRQSRFCELSDLAGQVVKAPIDFRLSQRENNLTAGVQSLHLGVRVVSEVSLKGKTKNKI